jgi:hypothetical protein
MKTILTADWAPHIETAVRRFAAVCVFVYVAGLVFGTWLHNLNDRLAGVQRPAPDHSRGVTEMVATPAPAPAPTLDPLAQAVAMVHIDGVSQRKAAAACGVSRSTLQRALKR